MDLLICCSKGRTESELKNTETIEESKESNIRNETIEEPDESEVRTETIEEDIDVKVIQGTEVFHGPDIYELSPGLCRGKMMIVNFEEFIDKDHQRVGSHKDVENLSSLFDQIGTHLQFYISTIVKLRSRSRSDEGQVRVERSEFKVDFKMNIK